MQSYSIKRSLSSTGARCTFMVLMLMVVTPFAYADVQNEYFNTGPEALSACKADAAHNNTGQAYDTWFCQGPYGVSSPNFYQLMEGCCVGGPVSAFVNYWYPTPACPAGQQFYAPGVCTTVPPDKNLCEGDSGNAPSADRGDRGNPCSAATGNKSESDTDLPASDGIPGFTRSYNSLLGLDVGLGFGWTSNYHRRLEVSGTNMRVRRGNGRGEPFNCSASTCVGDVDTRLTLTRDASGYTLTTRGGTTERYDVTGKLQSETDRNGRVTTYSYDTQGRLYSVTGAFGHQLTFGYDATNHVSSVTDSNNVSIGFSYATAGSFTNLTDVSYADGTGKRYHYERPTFLNHLTGISYISSTGASRYSTFDYDTQGRAILTEHAGGIQHYGFTYNSNIQRTVTDAIGTNEVMTFGLNLGVMNLLSRTNSADGKTHYQVFDTNNNLTCIQDEEGHVTTYTYNGTNQKTSMTEGRTGTCNAPVTTTATRTTTYQYLAPTLDLSTLIQSPSVATGQFKKTIIGYTDSSHPTLPTTITQSGFTPSGTAVSRSVSLSYNSAGKVATINGPRTDVNDIATLAYYNCNTGGKCGQLSSVTNALGQVTTFDSYNGDGKLTQKTDPNGLVTSYVYSVKGELLQVSETVPGSAPKIRFYRYTPAGDLSAFGFSDISSAGFRYNDARLLTKRLNYSDDYVLYGYDNKGNLTSEYIYNRENILLRKKDTAYDARNQVSQVDNAGSITKLLTDALGNLTRVTDPKSNPPTQNNYDSLNRVFNAINSLGSMSNYIFDANDRLKQVTAPNNATTQNSYDDLGNLLQEISPDRGTTTYAYDTSGNLKTQTDARGVIASYTYDALDRVVFVDYPGSAEDVTFIYDSGTYCTAGIGRLCQVTDSSGITQYSYNADGTVSQKRKTELGVMSAVGYSYNIRQRMTSLVYPDGRTINYSRNSKDHIGQMTMVLPNGTSQTILNSGYRPDGLLDWRTSGNGVAETRQYDLQGRLINQFIGSLDTRIYSPDLNGNALRVQSLSQDATYTYDKLDRLTQDKITVGATGTVNLTYDANGNRTSVNSNAYTITPNTNIVTKIANDGTLTYDTSGNILTHGGGYVYTYNNAGQLATAKISGTLKGTYTYNYLGQRTRKVAGSVTTIYHYDLEDHLIAESNSAGVLTVLYFWADDQPVAQISRNPSTGVETLVYLHVDNQGAPRLASSATATPKVVWKWNGQASGEKADKQDPDGDGINVVMNLRFPGQYFDSETGNHYNHFRYYRPVMGRYLTSDPIGLAGGLNTYSYSENNSLRWTDPAGLSTFACTQPLHSMPLEGKGERSGPDVYGNPLYHEYLCVPDGKGKLICGGQDRAEGPFSPGKPSSDKYKPATCKKVEEDNSCLEACLASAINNPKRPPYWLVGGGSSRLTGEVPNVPMNCQDWTDYQLRRCKSLCAKEKQ